MLSIPADEFTSLFDEMLQLRHEMAGGEEKHRSLLESVSDDECRQSARNLLHYLTLRSHDLRAMQERLTLHGLSSLGSAESHVLWNLESVLGVLRRLSTGDAGRHPRDALSPTLAMELLDRRTDALFGPPPDDRAVRVMVTMPADAAENYDAVRDIIAAGADCMRINCAHDDEHVWREMIAHLRRAVEEVGRPCRLLMDLPGPRVRTGPLPAEAVGPDPDDDGSSQPWLLLHQGALLVLTRDAADVRAARTDPETGKAEPARIACMPAGVLDNAAPGHRIWFDDGRIGGVIRETGDDVTVEITSARDKGEKLRAEKGINLPDTDLALPSLTPEDIALLPFIAEHADIVGYSFVRTAADVRLLRTEMQRANAGHLGVILKIETVRSFQQLPAMLFEGLAGGPFGVMIARGDLAVEGGFVRMAEVQEEILWLTEAAHVPAIWATQVMESLAKKGRPSRAEITDAAVGERAECVMLNKGPHIVDAVRALVSIFARMRGHQHKKNSRLRKLDVAAGWERESGSGRGDRVDE